MTPAESVRCLLSESADQIRAREKTSFAAQLAPSNGMIVLFGAGRLGRLCARALKKAGLNLQAFCDLNPALHGTFYEDVPILSPSQAITKCGSNALFVVSIWTGTSAESMSSRLTYLRLMHCSFVVPFCALLWALAPDELPFHSFDLPSRFIEGANQLNGLLDSLCDDESIGALHHELLRRLYGEFTQELIAPNQYFADGLVIPDEKNVFVDAGAYTGDTLRDFIQLTRGRFLKYYCFEPDPLNVAELYKKMTELPEVLRSRIRIHPIALADYVGQITFAGGTGTTSAVSEEGALTIDCASLDSFSFAYPPTMIKLDVEGAEYAVLKGARQTLLNCRPNLAVCVYHRPTDLWQLPQLLRELLPGHRPTLRTHGSDGWESVYYALTH